MVELKYKTISGFFGEKNINLMVRKLINARLHAALHGGDLLVFQEEKVVFRESKNRWKFSPPVAV